MSFFAIYSQRFVVYDYLNTHYKYSDTLSKDEVKEAKAYLDEQEQVDFMNHTQIRKDLNQLLKKGSYQVILYKTKSNKPDDKVIDSILAFCGRAPLKNTQKYNVFIKSSSKMSYIEWYPSFINYYHSYRIFDCILSLIITILFYLLLKNLKPLRSKKNVFYSLSSRMMFSFLCATLLVLTSFSFLYLNRSAVFEFLMDTFYLSEDYSSYVKKLEKQLQNFDLTKENKKVINHILKENALNHAYVELYDQDGIYFTDTSPLSNNNLLFLYSFDDLDVLEAPLYYDYPIHFKNQSVYLYITSFPMIPFQIPYIILSLLVSFSFYLIILQSFIRKRIQSIQNLQEDVFTLAIGDWNHEITVSDKDEIGRLAQDLNQMRIAFLQTMDNEQQARVANKELISSLSHDLRTPLTTLKGYLEIMNLKRDNIKFRDQYLQKCLDKVEEITYLSNKMFEYSLVFSTEYNSDLSSIPVQKVMDTLVDHIQYLREMDLHILYEPLQTSLSMDANFAMMQRILNNIFSNIQKYCDPWKDIVIQTTIEEDQFKMSFTNSINHHLDKVESNGIGLKSVKKMIEIHRGTFYQDETNDLFTIILTFPIYQ
ncbi:MAG: HAMP domain-containing histidine kinase [Holdemanella sp.]|uniref:HAMP domain-containing sensor histidine kinase n=1 Tax=Holdemanella sp. TaxID=1971762 RepID=UPI00258A078F|nr:HAMP domain-containing sensor histidine kinase [Holdemanella sp.]MCI7166464.1 HAMP domain-containing histidine kinase [Holdemanella sp.]